MLRLSTFAALQVQHIFSTAVSLSSAASICSQRFINVAVGVCLLGHFWWVVNNTADA